MVRLHFAADLLQEVSERKGIAMHKRLKALVTIISLATAAPMAVAQDFSSDALKKAFPYKDLPGVRPSDASKDEDDAMNCTQEVRLQNAMRRNADGEPGPGIVYRCEKDGIVVESARPPLRKHWNPLDAQ